jgi:hypothetical protein
MLLMVDDSEEDAVMVRLKGHDLEMFREIKEETQVEINAEVFRVVLRKYYNEHHPKKLQPNT